MSKAVPETDLADIIASEEEKGMYIKTGQLLSNIAIFYMNRNFSRYKDQPCYAYTLNEYSEFTVM